MYYLSTLNIPFLKNVLALKISRIEQNLEENKTEIETKSKFERGNGSMI